MLLLLDRDGVINRDRDEGILQLAHFEFLPGALEAMALLTQRGVQLAVCTNQSAVGRGVLAPETLDAIHAHMLQEIEKAGGHIARIYVAPDAPEHATERRKPGPGMLREALQDFGAEAARTPFVGDMLRDMEAAASAGCPRILVKSGKGARTLATGLPAHIAPTTLCEDLHDAAQHVLQHYAGGGQ